MNKYTNILGTGLIGIGILASPAGASEQVQIAGESCEAITLHLQQRLPGTETVTETFQKKIEIIINFPFLECKKTDLGKPDIVQTRKMKLQKAGNTINIDEILFGKTGTQILKECISPLSYQSFHHLSGTLGEVRNKLEEITHRKMNSCIKIGSFFESIAQIDTSIKINFSASEKGGLHTSVSYEFPKSSQETWNVTLGIITQKGDDFVISQPIFGEGRYTRLKELFIGEEAIRKFIKEMSTEIQEQGNNIDKTYEETLARIVGEVRKEKPLK